MSAIRAGLVLLLALAGARAVAAQEVSPTVADREAADRLRRVFSRMENLAQVEVEVVEGVVVLRGVVPTMRARETAQAIAEKMPAVVWVEDRITLAESVPAEAAPEAQTSTDEAVREQLLAVFAQMRTLHGVEVDVSAGVVHLAGEATTREAVAQAGALAEKMPGVLVVENQMAVSTGVTERLQPAVAKFFVWVQNALAATPLLLLALLVLFVTWLLARRTRSAPRGSRSVADRSLLETLVRQTLAAVIGIAGLFLALVILDATAMIGAVLGAAGVIGLALGFAFRDIVENYLASVILSLRRPFEIRDYVEIDGAGGTVVGLTTSETLLVTADGNHLRIPNGQVFKAKILNYSREPMRRLQVKVGVGYGEDLSRAMRLGLDTLRQLNGISAEPAPAAQVTALGDFAVQVAFYAWTNQLQFSFAKVSSEANRLIRRTMADEGVDLPFPRYDIGMLGADVPASPTAAPRGQPQVAPVDSGPAADQADVGVDRDEMAQLEKQIREVRETEGSLVRDTAAPPR